MNHEQWKRLTQVTGRAAELRPEERSAYLQRVCADDAEVLDLAVKALATSTSESNFLVAPNLEVIVGPGDESDLVGRRIGEFEVKERLGAGASGIVYRAVQTPLKRSVALKVLIPAFMAGDERRRRFEREALAVAKLKHPNIVQVFTTGQINGLEYLAMELIEGSDLAKEIQRLKVSDEQTGPLSPFKASDYLRIVAGIVAQAADALSLAHRQGVIHRDVKPANMLLDHQGQVHIVDFGLAKDAEFAKITATGQKPGTPAYMSPEQIDDSVGQVDARTDIYSLGVVLYELITLHRPYEGTSSTLPTRILRGECKSPSALNARTPRDLETICVAAINKNPKERYQSAEALCDDLRRFLRNEAITAKPVALLRRLSRTASRHRRAILVAGSITLAALVALAYSSWRERREREQALSDMFRRVADSNEWDKRPERVVQARLELKAYRERSPSTDSELEHAARYFEQRLSKDREQRIREGRALLRKGLGCEKIMGQFGGHLSTPSEREVALAMSAFQRAQAIYFEDSEIAGLASATTAFPRVTITLSDETLRECTDLDGAHVIMRPIDPLVGTRGDPIELGSLPLGPVAVPPGNWRFSIIIPHYGFSENTRYLQARALPYEIQACVKKTEASATSSGTQNLEDTFEGMVLVPPGHYKFDDIRPMGCDVGPPAVDLEEFYIDEAEVSNGDYIKFMQATGHPAPSSWLLAGYVNSIVQLHLGERATDFLELPVSGIEYADAQAYAEWKGKRLATHAELERALRGPHGARWPTDGLASGQSPGEFNIWGTDASTPKDIGASFQLYLECVRPIRDPEYRQQPSGLFHPFGNVSEYSESAVGEAYDDILQVKPWERMTFGGRWDAAHYSHTLDYHAIVGVGERYANDTNGIRCAKSVAP